MTPSQSKKPAPIQSGQECGFKDTSVPLCLPLYGGFEQLLQVIFPVTIRIFSLVQDLKTECLVLKICREFLPWNFVADFLKVGSHFPFVVCVFISFEMLALTLDHDHGSDRLFAVTLLDNKVRVDLVPLVSLD